MHQGAYAISVLFALIGVIFLVVMVSLMYITAHSEHSLGYRAEKILRQLATFFLCSPVIIFVSGGYWILANPDAVLPSSTGSSLLLVMAGSAIGAITAWAAAVVVSYFRDVSDRDPYIDLLRALSLQ